MTLENSVGALVARGDALMNLYSDLETFTRDRIAAVAAAFAASASGSVWVYVDPINGNDGAERAGNTAQPLKTLEAALARAPLGGFCYVLLLSPITLTSAISVRGKTLIIGSSTAVRHAINFVPTSVVQGAFSYRKMPGFNIEAGGAVVLAGLTINIPVATGFEAALPWASAALFQVQNDPFTTIPFGAILSCDVNLPAAPFVPILQQPPCFALIIKNAVLTGSPLVGRILADQANTGTSQPASNFRWLFTNLSAL